MLAPSTGPRWRSGAWASAASNQAGAGGLAPLNGASGEAISGGRSGCQPDGLVLVGAQQGVRSPIVSHPTPPALRSETLMNKRLNFGKRQGCVDARPGREAQVALACGGAGSWRTTLMSLQPSR